MLYVGLDIHSKRISVCVLNETGQVVQRSQVRTIDQMMRLLEGQSDRFEVYYEASCGYGHFHDLLKPVAARVLVAHPGRLRLIFRSSDKNDRKDAERLANRNCRWLTPIWPSSLNASTSFCAEPETEYFGMFHSGSPTYTYSVMYPISGTAPGRTSSRCRRMYAMSSGS